MRGGGIAALLLAVLIGTGLSIGPDWRWVPAAIFVLLYGGAYAFLIRVPNEGVVTLTPLHLFAGIYTLYVAIPAVLVFLLIDSPILHRSWSFPEDRILVFVLGGFLALVAGSLAAFLLMRSRRSSLLERYRSSVLTYEIGRDIWVPVAAVALISLVGTLAFFWLHRESYLAIVVAEQIGGQRPELRAGAGYLTLHFTYILPWICVLAYLGSRATEGRRLFWAAVLLGIVAFMAQAALLYRGNIVFFFLMLLMASQAESLKVDRDMLKWVAPAVLIFLLVTALRVESFLSPADLAQAVGTKIADRMVTPIRQFAYVLDTFPRDGFFPGETYLIDVSALLPGAQRSFNGIIYKEMGGAGFGSATITILGESYANFGAAGIALVPFSIGFVLQLVHHRLLRSRKTVVALFLYTLVGVYVAKAVLAGLTANLIQPVVVFTVVALPVLLTSDILKLSFAGR